MIEFIISEREAGLTVFRYASRVLDKAPQSLIRKFIRNKNIELNGKKSRDETVLSGGDRVSFFLAEETFYKFCRNGLEKGTANGLINEAGNGDAVDTKKAPDNGEVLDTGRILYEDEDFLFYDKPAGLRVQSDATGKISLNDQLVSYVGNTGVFRPSVCNRLDLNTSGIVMCGKSIKGLRILDEAIKARSIRKTYRAILYGRFDPEGAAESYGGISMTPDGYMRMTAYISGADHDNKVSISDQPVRDHKKIITDMRIIECSEEATYAELLLITGRKHQIRAQLSHLGHPVVGDIKYGNGSKNKNGTGKENPGRQGNKKNGKPGARRQMLHAYRIELPSDILGGMTIKAELPADMKECLKKASLKSADTI